MSPTVAVNAAIAIVTVLFLVDIQACQRGWWTCLPHRFEARPRQAGGQAAAILDDAEIEAAYRDGQGMMEFARKIEALVLEKIKDKKPC